MGPQFGSLSIDKEQEPNSMELKADEDIAVIALHFQRLAQEVGVRGHKAIIKFNCAIIKHGAALLTQVQADLPWGDVAHEVAHEVSLPRMKARTRH